MRWSSLVPRPLRRRAPIAIKPPAAIALVVFICFFAGLYLLDLLLDSPRWIRLLQDWLVVAGTLLAVGVALALAVYGDELRAIRTRPELDATMDASAPDCHKTVHSGFGQDIYYLRFRVHNRGRALAENVQVFLASVARRDEGASAYSEDPSFLPMKLTWSHTKTMFTNLPRETYAHCDLGFVYRSANDRGAVLLQLDLEVQPNTRTDVLPPDDYRLKLQLACASGPPTWKALDLSLGPNWIEDESEMLSRGIVLRMHS